MSSILVDGVSVVRNYTGITETDLISDSSIESFIDSAERELIRTSCQDFQVHSTSEVFYGNDTDIYIVENYPLLSITTLKYNTSLFDDYTYYFDRSGLITLKGRLRFNSGTKYTVDYSYGSEDLKPVAADQIRDMAAIQILLNVGSKESKGADGESFAAHSVSYPKGLPWGTFIDKIKTAIDERVRLLASRLISFTR